VQGLKSQVITLSLRLRKALRVTSASEAGASAVEYSLLVAFIATIIFTIVGTLGAQLVPGFEHVVAGL
jgi:Flp pilus assembly pilin Flp